MGNAREKEESWEIDLDRLRVSDVVLGEGEFGIVNKGSYRGKDVAVKQLKDGTSMADKNDLLSEIKMLKQAGRHPNIVSLVGVCTREEKILVVTELVPYGSLKNFLISKRVACVSGEASRYVNVRFGLNDRALLKIAFQIALGMQFLEKKKCVHRDLSARNVFIGENLVAKVGDFGLARDVSDYGIYTKISSGRVPWRWLSLESLKAQVYTAKSDEPYPNIETPRDLILWLSMGNRMSRPEHSSEKLYEIMCLCWKENPLMRPTFADITKRFPDCLQTYKNNYMNILKEDDRSVSEVSLSDGVSLSRTGNMTTTV
ncbi:unnamed protein product [Porites lobata]|uniref:Protein kinase domain-containing protein n=1 Tax=Porites lobata TaxID=104759 RepID=A0ABN8PKD3_9CNID|nr:unnamed protein product [Porites lobata]